MKKTLLFGALGLAMIATGCSDDEPTQTITYHVPAYNLAVDAATGDAVVSTTKYDCNFETYKGQATVVASDVKLPGGQELGFTAADMKYFSLDVSGATVVSVNSLTPALTSGSDITNFSMRLYDAKYEVKDIVVPGVSGTASTSFYPVISYRHGNYRVNTFWPDATYKGNTYTNYGEPEEYKNENISYRVVMNLNDSRNYTADVYLLNAKFAPKAPQIAVIRLKGLKVEFGVNGIVIKATDVVPDMIMGGDVTGGSSTDENGYLPNPAFTFRDFTFVSSGALTDASITYKVNNPGGAAAYEGRFNGSYLPAVSEAQ